ncbi:MAG TPA: nucleotide sugar dehydrogenase, partial [Paracoccaceae bacterium]|nr:nucleotide sugar dehydrogenase [Paracoccaceae bacterium]
MSLDLSLRLDETLPEILPEERIAVIGLGYVGLPVAVGFARHFAGVVALDIDESRIRELQAGFDRTLEVDPQALRTAGLKISDDARDLSGCSFFIITVPTPIDENNKPDLSPVRAACETIAPFLRPGAVVVLESTVYPGVTEEICAPLLEQLSGLKCGRDFTMGYSPERINPGDKIHRLETITKVVSGQDELTLERIAQAYGRVIPAGIFRAASIRTAEAAKVIENTQRDLNIALMNELAMICERMDIRTVDVLKAAGTKWNFLPFTPGLVGGHCIGVDPYYLTARAHELGYEPELILAGRRLNDSMGSHIANRA